jgi:predicted dienelactone hydrolase
VAEGTLAGRLARAGFVVAQPQHAGDNFQDTKDAGPTAWARRPLEVSRVIDALAQDPRWAPRLALDKVGVHGSSAGGATALVMAGASWRLLDYVRHCDTHLEADWGTCMGGAVTPAAQAARTERYRSVRGAPEFFLPASLKQVHGGPAQGGTDPRPDPRVAAVSAAVPVASMFTAEALGRIAVPVGLLRLGRDTMVVPALHVDRVTQACRRCRLIVDLPQGAHMDLMSPWPAEVARQVAAAHPRGAEASGRIDDVQRAAAFDAVAAFHREHLR